MTNRDGAGTGTFPAFRSTAGAVTSQYAAVNLAPSNGGRLPSTAVALLVDVSNTAGGNSDVRFDVATDSAFADIVWGSTQTNVTDGLLQVVASGLTNGTKYWWRARVAPTGTTDWGPWSGTARSTESVTNVPVTAATALSLWPGTAYMDAVDGNMATWWHSNGELPTWWRAQFATAQVITQMTLRIRPWSTAQTPRDFLIQGSNDGTAWTTLKTLTGVTYAAGAIDELRTYSWTNATAYLYARIYVTAHNGAPHQNFAEVTYGKDPVTVITYDPWTFTPDLDSGRGFAYVDENMGVDLTLDPDVTAAAYVDENMGVELVLDRDVTAAAYVDLNHGVAITMTAEGVEYAHYGDVNTLAPFPHIWFLRPAAGREGDGISIVCFGVGDLVTTYSGSVELYYGPTLGWIAVPVTAWNTYPPTVNAYTADRRLDPPASLIDMQHTVIEIVVPVGALPPGYPLRVRTVT